MLDGLDFVVERDPSDRVHCIGEIDAKIRDLLGRANEVLKQVACVEPHNNHFCLYEQWQCSRLSSCVSMSEDFRDLKINSFDSLANKECSQGQRKSTRDLYFGC